MFSLLRKLFKPRPPQPAAVPHDPAALVEAAHASFAAGRQAEAIAHSRAALAMRPDDARAAILLARLLRNALNIDEAIQVLRQAQAAAPGDTEIEAHLRQLLGNGQVPMWHFSMMNDAPRNRAYEEAIRACVKPGDRVLEIGTGSGLLAMMAARAGAAHVHTCEMARPVAETAARIVAQNGYADHITVIARESSALQIPRDLPGPADVLVAEIISSDLIGEGMLDAYEDARARLLKPGARILPQHGAVVAQLAGSAQAEAYMRVGTVEGFDLQGFNDFTPTMLYPDEFGLQLDAYSSPFEVFGFDLQADRRAVAEQRAFDLTVTADGLCHGVLQWIRLTLAPGIVYENAPADGGGSPRSGHWRPILHTFPRPLAVRQGQLLRLVAAHDSNGLMFHLGAGPGAHRPAGAG